jgi:hypothetical protein
MFIWIQKRKEGRKHQGGHRAEILAINAKFLFNQAPNHQREWTVGAQLHVFSISAPVGEQQSFHVPVTCTWAKKYPNRCLAGFMGGS